MQTKYLLLILALPLFACEYVNDHYIKPTVAIPVISGDTLRGRIVERTDTTITLYNLKGFEGRNRDYGDHNEIEIHHRVILVEGISGYKEGFAQIMINEKYGFIDTLGKIVVDPIYDKVRFFNEKRVVVVKDGKYGCIDTKGNYVIRPRYKKMLDAMEGMLVCEREDEWCEYRNATGKLMFLKLVYSYSSFSEGLAYVEEYLVEDDMYGRKYFIDRNGETAIKLHSSIESAKIFSEELVAVKKDGLWGYMDRVGAWIFVPQFNRAENFSEGLAVVSFEGSDKVGVINKWAEVVVEQEFESIGRFSGRAAPASITIDSSGVEITRWGIIDRKGNYIIEPIYEKISDYFGEWATVQIDGNINFINQEGEFLFEFLPNIFVNFENGIFPVARYNYWYLLDDTQTPKFAFGSAYRNQIDSVGINNE